MTTQRRSNFLDLPIDKPLSPTWAEAVERSPLWDDPARRDEDRRAALKRFAAEIARAAWCAWEQADAALLGDSWRDERYPLRVLERLSALVSPGDLGAEETLIAVVAPFVREGILAAGATWMAAVGPLDLEGWGSAPLARRTLEQVHRSREELVRHGGRLEAEDREGVCFWMMEHALQQTPHLFRPAPMADNKVREEFLRAMERAREAAAAQAWFSIDRLLRVARAVGADTDALDAEGGVGRDAEEIIGGVRLRVPAIAYLLCIAGWQALDLRKACDVAVNHVGRDAGISVTVLRDALREASWSAVGDRHTLAYTCPSSVVDFVLRDLVERADAALERTRARFTADADAAPALLKRLPKRLSDDELKPERAADGRPRYTLPHARFQLDHQRIRELLIGQQLYGDPALAIRELYQNALDACRYRRARGEYLERTGSGAFKPYRGRIALQQSIDERGRTYIECADNGVGMTRSVLERVFAMAGRRFHDMPDFIEERALWQGCEPPVELYPNSQFGVGVFSYFMLAAEVTIFTRRYEASGALGQPLVVHIASPSGLLRISEARENDMPQAGTKVRLYLVPSTSARPYSEKRVSCLATVTQMLRVAEFETIVEEDAERIVFRPGDLTQQRPSADEPRFMRATTSPDVWWCAGEKGMLLSDGLATNTRVACVIANLHGPRSPEMSVDRKEVRKWDHDWLNRVMEESYGELVDWNELSFEFLWALEGASVRTTRQLVLAVSQQHEGIRIKLSSGDIERIPLQVIGCFHGDKEIVSKYRPAARGLSSRESAANIHIIVAWRLSAWAKAGALRLPEDWFSRSLLDEHHLPAAAPGDAFLLRSFLGRSSMWGLFEGGWIEGEVPLPHVLRAAFRLGEKPSAVLKRIRELAPLGVKAPPLDERALDEFDIAEGDLRILSQNLDGEAPWLEGEVSPGHIFKASQRLNIKPGKIIERLAAWAPFGIKLQVDKTVLDQIDLTANDLRLLSLCFERLWLEDEISPLHVLDAACTLNTLASSVIERLAELAPHLGVRLSTVDARLLDTLQLTDSGLEVLLWIWRRRQAWVEGQIPIAGIFAAAKSFAESPVRLIERLRPFEPLGVKLPATTGRALDELSESEDYLRLLSYTQSGEFPQPTAPAALEYIIRGARTLERPLSQVFTMTVALGLAPEYLRPPIEALGDALLDKGDERLVGAFDSIRAADPAAAFRLGKERARYRLWYLSNAEFEARIERLLPLVQASLQYRFRRRWSRSD